MAQINNDRLARKCAEIRLGSIDYVPVRRNHHIRDVTNQFAKASEALQVGQLVKDVSFSLFESVQALEIMDPKMDTGYLEPGETLEETYDVCKNISPEEVLWIMDRLLCLDMAWHQGYPLAQNVFMSLHIYNLLQQEREPGSLPFFRPLDGSKKQPGPWLQTVLRAYCVALIKCSDVVIEVVQSQQYYDEEDFVTHTFGYTLLNDVSDHEACALAEDALEWLRLPEQRKRVPHKLLNAIELRLASRLAFLKLILPDSKEYAIFESQEVIAKIIANGVSDISQLAKPVEDSISTKMPRKLANNIPPRPVVEIDVKEAYSQFQKMQKDMEVALQARDAPNGSMSLRDLTSFLWAFSELDPCTFARAILQMYLFNEGRLAGTGPEGMTRILYDELRKFFPDPQYVHACFWDVEVPSDSRHRIARSVDYFLQQASMEYINVARSLCQNRCRIRRCLTNILKDLDNLLVDMSTQFFGPGKIPPAPEHDIVVFVQYTMWLMTLELLERSSIWAVELGFEQEVYRAFELAGLYGYVASCHNRISSAYSEYLESAGGNVPELKRLLKLSGLPQTPDIQSLYHAERRSIMIMEENSHSDLATGLSTLFALLNRCGYLPLQKTKYSSQKLQFELRMRPFLNLEYGKTFDYEKFRACTWRHPTPEHIVSRRAVKVLGDARDGTKDVLRLVKAAVAQRKSGAGGSMDADIVAAAVTGANFRLRETTNRMMACVKACLAADFMAKMLADVGKIVDEAGKPLRRVRTAVTQVRSTSWYVPEMGFLD